MVCKSCNNEIKYGSSSVLVKKDDWYHYDCYLIKSYTFAGSMAIAMENMKKDSKKNVNCNL